MSINELFIVASRQKFRFPFKGVATVEDLWDLDVRDLDTIFKALNSQKKQAQEEVIPKQRKFTWAKLRFK